MKTFVYSLLLLAFIGCKSQSSKTNPSQICPENGICISNLIANSSLNLKTDSTEKLYATVNDGSNVVFKYSYSKNTDERVVDGHYIEEIYFEFDSDVSNLTLKNEELKSTKLLYRKKCYCKGEAGFYHIKKGELSIDKIESNTYNIELNFQIDEVTSIITSINEIVILK